MENEIEKEIMKDFTAKIKEGLAELGLIKMEERLKITGNSKGMNFEYSLLGAPEDNLDRMDKLNAELDKRLKR